MCVSVVVTPVTGVATLGKSINTRASDTKLFNLLLAEKVVTFCDWEGGATNQLTTYTLTSGST